MLQSEQNDFSAKERYDNAGTSGYVNVRLIWKCM